MRKRLTLMFVVAAIAATTLTACLPQSRQSFDRYVEALDAVPGVTVDYTGVSTPLPFAVHGSVDVSLDADADTLAELLRVVCETEVNASVNLSITARAGGSRVEDRDVRPCADLVIDIVAAALAVEEFEVEIGVDQIGRDDVVETRVGVETADGVSESLATLAAISDFLPEGQVRLFAEGVTVITDALPLAVAYLDDFAALHAEYEVVGYDLTGDSLVIRTYLASSAQQMTDFLTARDPERYADLVVVVTDALAGDVPQGTEAVVILLRDRIVAELGLSAKIGGRSVFVQAVDTAEVVAFSRQIGALNTDEVTVGITIVGDDDSGVPQFRVREEPALTPSNNPYPVWVEQFERLVATGYVGTVEVGAGSLEAWLFPADYDDADAFDAVRKVLDAIAAEYDLSRWELNNRDLTR